MKEYINGSVLYAGVNDHQIDLFEGQYKVPHGMSYNSYVILDEKTAVLDTVDRRFSGEWLDRVREALQGRRPDYLVVHHMEPDHSSSITDFLAEYPDAKIVGNAKTFAMMSQFFDRDFSGNSVVVQDGDTLDLGKRRLTFIFAPMVHWPEVMVSYESADKILFSADGFGKFGARDFDEPWADEARRYYIGIVGKYGMQTQALLKKAAALDIRLICPLHGPELKDNIASCLDFYNKWSSYTAETDGILVAYTSVYGNTRKAVTLLAEKLRKKGCRDLKVMDLARCDLSEALAEAFRREKLILATTTYNMELFPFMDEFIHKLVSHNFCGRTVGLIENGSWAPAAAKLMREKLSVCKNLTFAENSVRIKSALNSESAGQLEKLADEFCASYSSGAADFSGRTAESGYDMNALSNIGYGLYLVTSADGAKDNGLIVNTVTQLTSAPLKVAVSVEKGAYSYQIIKTTGILNVNCLSTDTPFSVFERFGFASGRDKNKFDGVNCIRSANGLAVLPEYANSFLSLKVTDCVDLGTHAMFLCEVTEARVLSGKATMTYSDYHTRVKPKPAAEGKKGWVCKICGYVYEGEELPADFICPICKHGAADFERIQ